MFKDNNGFYLQIRVTNDTVQSSAATSGQAAAEVKQAAAEVKQAALKATRQGEVRPILEKLSELHLKVVDHPELIEMIKIMQQYVENGKRQTIHIPFPAHNCDIDGVLQIGRTWVRFTAKKT